MNYADKQDLLITAEEHFNESEYSIAEPILNQLILKNMKSPKVFHMLGTIYYDQGKFKKAIQSFKRALEIEPSFIDSSVGLSIIYNDLGKYELGKKVFVAAQKVLDENQSLDDPYLNEKLARKHDELAEMYKLHKRYKEALEQAIKAKLLSNDEVESTLKTAELFFLMGDNDKSAKELKSIIKNSPDCLIAHIKLGEIYYSQNNITAAINHWESVLTRKPDHPQALRLLKRAQSVNSTVGFEL